MTTGYLWHEVFGWHDTGTGPLMGPDPAAGVQPHAHLAHPDTKRRLHELVAVSGVLDHLTRVSARPATEAELLRVHTPEHVQRIQQESRLPKGGDAGDGFSPFGKGAYELAALAAGGTLAMTEAVVARSIDNGYALVNPPGHHARPETGMGFCIFSNVAIAVRHAQAALGIGRVAVVDWDVHHGNGTQAAFEDDPSVLTISLHQDNCFPPNSGPVDDRGTGAGTGCALNIPMPPGTGDGGYRYATDTVIAPALEAFAPELVVVASGFDANGMDPLARQLITSQSFVHLTKTVLDAAARSAEGRLVLVQEGGYSPVYVPFCGLATIAALAGLPEPEDPFYPILAGQAGHDLQPHQKQAVDRAAAHVADLERPAATG
jgi:acetoin utilization deacetylase AcuC-like enzyme